MNGITKIKVNINNRKKLLSTLERTNVSFEINDNIVSVPSDNDIKIIAVLTANHYDYSVIYEKGENS